MLTAILCISIIFSIIGIVFNVKTLKSLDRIDEIIKSLDRDKEPKR